MSSFKVLTNDQRRLICQYKKDNPTMSHSRIIYWFREVHGHQISQGTVSNTLKHSTELLAEKGENNRKRRTTLDYPLVDKALIEWFKLYQSQISISGHLIKTKAALFMKKLYPGKDSLKECPEGWSNGWLESFKSRHNFRLFKTSGESGSVHRITPTSALPRIQDTLEQYNPEDVFNMDETGLFFRIQQDRALATFQLEGQKKDKERISIVICANESGTEKIPLTIIGHCKKPRASRTHLNNIERYGMKWRFNTKACMTTDIFQEWIKIFDSRMTGRSVLLLLDNCPSHSIEELQLRNTKVLFLPLNTTSAIQPSDAGIIRTFKACYRRNLNSAFLHILEKSPLTADFNSKIDVAEAILLAIEAWDAISNKTIQDCWRRSGIRRARANESIQELGNSQFQSAVEEIQVQLTALNYKYPIPIEQILDNPEENTIMEYPTEDDIIEFIQQTEDSNEENNAKINTIPPPSIEEVIKSLESVISYEETIQEWPGQADYLLQQLKALRRAKSKQTASVKQKRITDFLTSAS